MTRADYKSGIAALALLLASGTASAQEAVRWELAQPHVASGEVRYYVAQDDALPASEYWIGVQMATPVLPDLIKEQLGLEHGLVVTETMADSPAAKAGIQKNDILLQAGDKPLKEPADLIRSVDEAKENELVLTILRGGKEQSVRVTPVKREQAQAAAEEANIVARLADALRTVPQPELRNEIQKLEEALARLKLKTGESQIVIARPGIVTSEYNLKLQAEAFPKDLFVRITKDGNRPAEVHVRRGDQRWEVTDETLDELPQEVRGHVQRLLGRGGPLAIKFRPELSVRPVPPTAPALPTAPSAPRPPAAPTPPRAPRATLAPVVPTSPPAPSTPAPATDDKLDAILKRLEQMASRSLEQLQSEVEKLRKELNELRAAKPEGANRP